LQAGFSLIEIVIATALFAVVAFGAFERCGSSRQARAT